MKNREIAQVFERIADALELKGETIFQVNAYRKVARILRDMIEDVEQIRSEDRLREIPGIGEGTAKKIEEYLNTGRMEKYAQATKGLNEELLDMLSIQGLGPKTLKQAHDSLGVDGLSDLKRAIENGTLEGLPRMGAKKVENIRKGIELFERSKGRIPLGIALPIADSVIKAVSEASGVRQISAAGSLRRMTETVGDIDILAASARGEKVVGAFTGMSSVTQVLASGSTKGSVLMDHETQVDMRVVKTAEYGAALQYFTGSTAHNVKLRGMARARGMKLSEYGVFKGEKRVAGKTEEAVYRALGLPLIPPELREDRGEIEAAQGGALPELVSDSDILGDLHVHSAYSDGADTIEELARVAKSSGLQYIAICDHSKSAQYAGGIDESILRRQIEEIERVNNLLRPFRVLKGIEVDILKDGSLDLSDDVLNELDIVVASVHMGFKQNVTERMIRAMENPRVRVICHPTGRLISRREGYDMDLERVIEAAASTGTALEINAYYDRLDLNDVNVKRAREKGAIFAIGTDSHSTETLWFRQLGVGVARRGWLGPKDLLNCLPVEDLISSGK